MKQGRELTVGGRVDSPDEILVRRARLAICKHSDNVAEARALMDMVGLGPGQRWGQ